MVCQMFGVMWVMPGRMKDCLGSFFFLIGKKSILLKAQGAQPMYTGCIQKEPTKQAFN
jgi:hypothetical protein